MDIKSLFQKQKMMRTVLLSLIPVALLSVYLFGWRLLLLFGAVALAAVVCEYLVMRSVNGPKTKVSEAALVSAALFTLSLPPGTPVWVALVGIAFGIVFGKAAFGGFGRNVFNPALVGRCFIYIAFPHQMTAQWALPFAGLPGGFTQWAVPADAVTAATPIITYNTTGAAAPLGDLFLGNIAGSLGETGALLILLAGVFLVWKKVASWRLMVSTAASFTLLSAALHFLGVRQLSGTPSAPPLFALLSGSILFAAVFMVTDPVSAPKIKAAQWVSGTMVGLITVVIRTFSLFTAGVTFAILIVNALTPLIEMKIKALQARGKQPAKEAAP